RNGGAEHAERAHFAHDIRVELALTVGGEHARKQLLLSVIARGVAHHALVLAQLAFKVERIVPFERGVLDLRGFDAALLGLFRNLRHRGAPTVLRHPEARAQRASKGGSPARATASFEGRSAATSG